MARRGAATRELERARGIVVPHVLHRRGRRIVSFHRARITACKTEGALAMIFHDLRRTAVRNMVRAGVPERAR